MFRLVRDRQGACLAPQGSVVCIGAFDGVHCGHRALLHRVRERAARLGVAAAVVSFEPIPREYFARTRPLTRLDDARGKIRQIVGLDIDLLMLLRFNADLASMPAGEFVEKVLVGRLAAREIWVGADFRFGHNRVGDVDFLREMGSRYGFETEVFPEFTLGGQRVRSSVIREMLWRSDFNGARHLLGRPFKIGGHVVRGRQLGRKLGYPTANIRLGRRTSPVNGVFAVRVHGVAGFSMPAVASLGVRPTVAGVEPLLEAHLFDFDGDLYGRRIDVEFVAKLRDEEKFDSLESMVEQIGRDVEQARALLAPSNPVFQPDFADDRGRVRSSGASA